MAKERIATEKDHGLHRIGLPGEDGAVDGVGLHIAWVERWSQWVLGQTKPYSGLHRRQQLPAHDWIVGSTGDEDVAAASIELPREGVEAADGPIGLPGVAMLLKPYPGGIAGRLLGRK